MNIFIMKEIEAMIGKELRVLVFREKLIGEKFQQVLRKTPMS